MANINLNLRDWQQEAYDIFVKNNYKGLISASTGSGKTILGIHYISKNLDKNIIILVPTVQLMYQWNDELTNYGILCGMIGDGLKDYQNIQICVINSVRALQGKHYDILICDEAHRYLSNVNSLFLQLNNFSNIMCLTATANRQDNRDYNFLGVKEIYIYTQKDAIKNKDLCKYTLINVGIDFLPENKEIYKKYDSIIKSLMPEFHNNLSEVYGGKWTPNKLALRRAIQKRKTLINNSSEKNNAVINIIKKESQNKIIIFCEFIKTAELIHKELIEINISSIIYHSSSKNKQDSLESFRLNKCNILITVKSLDEGLNVPDANIGIIISGNSTSRQVIQRVGRLLRKKEEEARIYQLYIKDSKDVDWLKTRLQSLSGYSKIVWL